MVIPDLETVIPFWEHMKRTLVPKRDTCSLYGFQLDKRARFRDSDSYSRTLQLFYNNLSSSVFRVKGIQLIYFVYVVVAMQNIILILMRCINCSYNNIARSIGLTDKIVIFYAG